MIRTAILKELDQQGWSVLELSQKCEVRYQSINDYLKHNKELSSKNIEKVFSTLKLTIIKIDYMKNLVEKAKKITDSKKVFEVSIKKLTELYKADDLKNSSDIETDIKFQLCGWLMYAEKCKGLQEIENFAIEVIEYYKQNEKQLTDRTRKHDFFNQFEFAFCS